MNPTPQPIRFTDALRFWFKLGCISFGGPAGQIAIMHRELVEERRWISENRFLHALNYCMLLPGPEAQQLATYIGWLMHRTWGGVVAGVLFVLPSLLLLIGLSGLYVAFGQLPAVAGVLYGIKPAVAALVVAALWRIGGKTLKNPRQTPVLWAIAIASFFAIAVFKIAFPWVVGAAALLGLAGARFAPGQFAVASGHGSSLQASTGAVIDDDTPTPAHAKFSKPRLAIIVIAGVMLWAVPMGLLLAWQANNPTLVNMGLFFSKAAWVTFGGAYAVLPYVYQGAVEQFAWLTGPQMMDGLALGETTPGPLIMVVAFVGYLGGVSQQVLGPDALFLGGALAACVVTWFTFLPSFLLILAGGPVVEATHGKLGFTAPLTAITAAVVGVIASLALFFLWQVAKASGGSIAFGLPVDVLGLGLSLAASLALMRYKQGVIRVILACGLAGLAIHLLR